MPDQSQLFTRMLAHDLRSPITAASEALRLSETVPPDRAVMLRDIANENLKRAERIVYGLRGFVRAEGEESPIERIDVDEIVGEIIEELDLASCGKSGAVQIVGRLGTLFGSRVHVSHTFRNLISNAVLHNSESEGLEVAVGRRSIKEATFYVRDNGQGIAKEHHETIFKPFQSTNRAANNGMGLGLALVSSLVTQAGGSVTVESDVGCGATFWVEWPGEWVWEDAE